MDLEALRLLLCDRLAVSWHAISFRRGGAPKHLLESLTAFIQDGLSAVISLHRSERWQRSWEAAQLEK